MQHSIINFFLFIFINLLIVLPIAENASLSAAEQKQYKHFLEGQGLYTVNDDVTVLTMNNFDKEIIGSKQAWFVEFYNSWCGFCQRFAPSWKALGTDISEWRDFIKVGAIDCSDDDNNPICRNYEIMGYPTLRYFHENYEKGPKNLGLEITKGADEEEIRHNLVERLIQEQKEGRGKMLPDLLPINVFDNSNLMQSNAKLKYIFLVFLPQDSLIGPELILDFHKLDTIRIVYSFDETLKTTMKIVEVPSVLVMDVNDNRKELPNIGNTRDSIKDAMKTYLKDNNVELTTEPPTIKQIYKGKWLDSEVPDMNALMQERAQYALKERIKKMGDVVFQMDLETALRYSLKHEIRNLRTISGEKLKALQNYFELLKKYFPFGINGQHFLQNLSAAVQNQNSIEGRSLAVMIEKAEQETSNVYSSPKQWLGCKGSTPEHRGYPCGLWKMFHYMTVNVAEVNAHNKNSNPREALEAMLGYIKHFFGCADCSEHFQDIAMKRNLHDVASHDSAILWLWMTHNEVNKRLAGDQTEDPEYPKIQFPLIENCPHCRYSNQTWNLQEVLKYLKHMYSSVNVRYIGSDTRILHGDIHSDINSATISTMSSVFKSFDMIVILFFFFNLR